MRTYRTEFPDFELDVEIRPEWTDSSWHNDTCPSWEVGPDLQVYVDYADPERRECGEDSIRFALHDFTERPSNEHWPQCIFHTEDWDEMLERIAHEVSKRSANQDHRDGAMLQCEESENPGAIWGVTNPTRSPCGRFDAEPGAYLPAKDCEIRTCPQHEIANFLVIQATYEALKADLDDQDWTPNVAAKAEFQLETCRRLGYDPLEDDDLMSWANKATQAEIFVENMRRMLDYMNSPPPKGHDIIERVARKFSGLVIDALANDEILRECIERNRSETDSSVCHTHDYLDSNMLMAEALQECGLKDDRTDVWNAAWDLAQHNEFYTREHAHASR